MRDGAGLDDVELARRAARGCLDAFAMLAARHQVGIVHYVRQMAGRAGRSDADDIAQDALVRAWQAIGRYDSRWAFSTWLFTIARRTCLNHARARRRRQIRETVGFRAVIAADDPSLSALAGEQAARLWDVAGSELTEPQFTALWLRYAEGKSIPDVAAVLGRPVASVKVILFRARRKLEPLVRNLTE